ncbi:MAG: hypothetical protein I8H87_02440 [Comamonadaceae bacterium]|jgi:hypothetical protein|nr:hypothetical protein [Comamonadaceae bacterium]
MLDTSFHQGAGLHSFTPQSELRVLAVASQGQAQSGLETLWQLCASLQRLGYPVVVLDGTAYETEASPGLHHLLRQAPWHEGASLDLGAMASSLAVLPAARGLPELARIAQAGDAAPLQGLLPYFRAYGLLVLHAPASMLGPLLTHTATTPLVVMPPGAAGVLTSYQTLKQIVLHTGLPCTVAAVLQENSAPERRKAAGALRTLQQCADRHLGGRMRTTTLFAHSGQDVQRLALQLLENAGTISGTMSAMPTHNLTGLPSHGVRSH